MVAASQGRSCLTAHVSAQFEVNASKQYGCVISGTSKLEGTGGAPPRFVSYMYLYVKSPNSGVTRSRVVRLNTNYPNFALDIAMHASTCLILACCNYSQGDPARRGQEACADPSLAPFESNPPLLRGLIDQLSSSLLLPSRQIPVSLNTPTPSLKISTLPTSSASHQNADRHSSTA